MTSLPKTSDPIYAQGVEPYNRYSINCSGSEAVSMEPKGSLAGLTDEQLTRFRATIQRPSSRSINPHLRRSLIEQCLIEGRGAITRLAKAHGVSYPMLATAVRRARLGQSEAA